MANNSLIVDVREPDEYDDGHVRGAVNIPYTKVDREIERYATDRTKPISVYCGRGGRAAKAEDTLKKMGYRNVSNLGGYSYLAEPSLVTR